MGMNMLGEPLSAPVSARGDAQGYSQSASSQPVSFWGSLPQGVRTVIKVALVAVVAYAAVSLAVPYLITNFPAAAAYLTPVAEAFGAVGSGITSAMNSVFLFFGLSPLGTTLAPAAAAVLPEAAGVTAATVAGAATLATAKAATVTAAAASITSSPALTTAPSMLDPSISAQTPQIDPSALNASMASKKSGILASLDSQHAGSTSQAPVDLPENAFQQSSAHQSSSHQNAAHASEKAAKLTHIADEIREKELHHRERLHQIHDKLASWEERVGGKKQPSSPSERGQPAPHSERVNPRESSFAQNINADRERLDNAISHA